MIIRKWLFGAFPLPSLPCPAGASAPCQRGQRAFPAWKQSGNSVKKNGVLYSMPASDLLTFIITAFVIAATDRQLSQPAARPSGIHGHKCKMQIKSR